MKLIMIVATAVLALTATAHAAGQSRSHGYHSNPIGGKSVYYAP
ncbi:hypothetical protein N8D56_08345 [Devosia sp. A8/3-2]|nr:hypothetical protein N8D56_08345 [Devosia sp. A8/3-2]